jgi:flagellar protein FlaF
MYAGIMDMYQQRYEEIAQDSSRNLRSTERRVLELAIGKLLSAQEKGSLTPEAFEATAFLRRIWAVFISDLSHPENALNENTRAGLISIGTWIQAELDRIDSGQSTNFSALIDINRIIADGLV